LIVDSPYLKRRQAALLRQIDRLADGSLRGSGDQGREAFSHWARETSEYLAQHGDGWIVLKPIGPTDKPPASSKAPIAKVIANNAVLFTGASSVPMNARRQVPPDRISFAVGDGNIAAIRLELLPDESHRDSIGRGGGAPTVQVSFSLRSESGRETKLLVYFADADLKDDRFVNGYPVIGIKDAWKTSSADSRARQSGFYVLDKPLAASHADQLIISVNRNGPGCIRISTSPIATLNPVDASSLDAVRDSLAASHPEDESPARLSYLLSTGHDSESLSQVRSLHKQVLECREGKSPVVVTMSVSPQVTRVLPRGNRQAGRCCRWRAWPRRSVTTRCSRPSTSRCRGAA